VTIANPRKTAANSGRSTWGAIVRRRDTNLRICWSRRTIARLGRRVIGVLLLVVSSLICFLREREPLELRTSAVLPSLRANDRQPRIGGLGPGRLHTVAGRFAPRRRAFPATRRQSVGEPGVGKVIESPPPRLAGDHEFWVLHSVTYLGIFGVSPAARVTSHAPGGRPSRRRPPKRQIRVAPPR
jgi:hypothetical protein